MLKDSRLDLTKLSPLQKQIISSREKKIQIKGHAGSGKTTCLKHIVKRWITEDRISPSRILVMSYDYKMGFPLLWKIQDLIGTEKCEGLTVHSVSTLCKDILSLYPEEFGVQDCLEMDHDCYRLMYELACLPSKDATSDDNQISHHGLNNYSVACLHNIMTKHQCSLEDALIMTKEGCRWDEDARTRLPERIDYCETQMFMYGQLKERLNVLNPFDRILRVVECLEKNDSLRKKVSKSYDHIVCDNVEEMTALELRFLRAFAKDSTIVFSGDQRQAFKDYDGISHFDRDLVREYFPDITLFRLNSNFRCPPSVCNLAGWLMERSPFKTDYLVPTVPVNTDDNSPAIRMICGNTKEEASSQIVSLIKEYHDNGGSYSDIMILGESRWEMFDIQKNLSAEKIPHKCIDISDPSRTGSNHLKYFTSAMRIASNWRNASAWWDLMSMYRYMDDLDTSISLHLIRSLICCDSREAAITLFAESDFSTKAVQFLKDMFANDDPVIAIEMSKETTLPYLKDSYERSIKKVMHDIEILEKRAYMYDTLKEFVSGCIIQMDIEEPTEIKKEAITISSIYRAKPEEAKFCIIMNAGNDIWPKRVNISNGNYAMEQQRRQLYSAITRSSETLVLCKVPEREFGVFVGYGFLKDVPSDVMIVR